METQRNTQQVWEQFSADLRAFIRRRVSDENVADDLLQEVFVRVHSKLDSVSDDERLAAWLYRIARNVITDHYRRVNIVVGTIEEVERADNPDDGNLNELVVEWVKNRIAQLPDTYREAVLLSELHGVPQTEIAKRIGLSESGTKSRVQRGRRMLKEQLLHCCHFEFDRAGNVLDYEVISTCADCCDSSAECP